MGRKLDDVRIVTFKEDYRPGGVLIYPKGVKQAIHKSVVELLEKNTKAKFEVADFDEKKETAAAKEAFEESKKPAK